MSLLFVVYYTLGMQKDIEKKTIQLHLIDKNKNNTTIQLPFESPFAMYLNKKNKNSEQPVTIECSLKKFEYLYGFLNKIQSKNEQLEIYFQKLFPQKSDDNDVSLTLEVGSDVESFMKSFTPVLNEVITTAKDLFWQSVTQTCQIRFSCDKKNIFLKHLADNNQEICLRPDIQWNNVAVKFSADEKVVYIINNFTVKTPESLTSSEIFTGTIYAFSAKNEKNFGAFICNEGCIFDGDRIFYGLNKIIRCETNGENEQWMTFCYSQTNDTFQLTLQDAIVGDDLEEILCNYTGIHSYHLDQKLNKLFLFFEDNNSNNADNRFIAKNTYNIPITVIPVQKDEECIISPNGTYALKYSKKDGTNVQLLDMSNKHNENNWVKVNISLKLLDGKANVRFSADEKMILFINSQEACNVLNAYTIKTSIISDVVGTVLTFELHPTENIAYIVHKNGNFTIFDLDRYQSIYQKELLVKINELDNFPSRIKINDDKKLLLLPYGRETLIIDTLTGNKVKECGKGMQFKNGTFIDDTTLEQYRLTYREYPKIEYLTDQGNDDVINKNAAQKRTDNLVEKKEDLWKKNISCIFIALAEKLFLNKSGVLPLTCTALALFDLYSSRSIIKNVYESCSFSKEEQQSSKRIKTAGLALLLCLGCLSPALWSYYHAYTHA